MFGRSENISDSFSKITVGSGEKGATVATKHREHLFMKSSSYPLDPYVCFQETVCAHAATILSEMATGMEEDFHKYFNELVSKCLKSRGFQLSVESNPGFLGFVLLRSVIG